MKRKIRIFLCDMVHNYLGAGSYMFPLNIGFIAAYTYKHFPNEVEIKLFKYPNLLLEELNSDVPEVIGFSNYTWNADLNNKLAQFVKSHSKKNMVVFGGPNINYTEQGIKDFFIDHRSVDFYVPFQGETPFVNLLKKYLDSNLDLAKLKEHALDGVYFYIEDGDQVMRGKTLERIKNPDDIPSPYLTGLLDEFFDYDLVPIAETNRGCPYRCTFCAQGLSSHHKINFFSLERVKAELDYIAKRVKKTNLLNLADSNFGIVERDIKIARHIANLYERTGYPRKCNTNWAKNQPKIFEIAKILRNINLIVSLQSLNDIVLKNIKRRNIKISVFRDIVKNVNDLGGISGTEIILGLPGETKNSHLETIRKLFDWDVSYIICYNGLVLDGTELSLFKENGEFKCKTKYRLIDSSFGQYDGILSFEAEEGIVSTDTMTEDELLSFRPVHWLIQFLWNYRFYYDFLKYIKYLGINPLDYIMKLIEGIDRGAPEKVKNIFDKFKHEAKEEWLDSIDDLQNYYIQHEKFKLLKEGLYGKINGKYIFKVLLEVKREFEEYMYNVAGNYLRLSCAMEEIFHGIINFLSATIIDFNQPWEEIDKDKFITTKYNLLDWRKSRYEKNIEAFYNPRGLKFHLYLPQEQGTSLKKLLIQYDHKNKNVTLRKMSEFMSVNDFFYKVSLV